jgi:hypothetical protein
MRLTAKPNHPSSKDVFKQGRNSLDARKNNGHPVGAKRLFAGNVLLAPYLNDFYLTAGACVGNEKGEV